MHLGFGCDIPVALLSLDKRAVFMHRPQAFVIEDELQK
jgi:hypothetical protein